MIHNAMILTAGYATRLRPLSASIPKAALPVLGRPLIHHVLDWLTESGVREVGVNLHYLPEAVHRAAASYPNPEVHFHFSEEKGDILFTAGALSPLKALFRGGGTFVLVNGKIVTDLNLEPALEFHRRAGNAATMVLLPNPRAEDFSHVVLDGDGQLVQPLPVAQAVARGLEPNLFTGIHILEPDLLDFIPDGRPYHIVKELYPELHRRGMAVRGFMAWGRWLEFSTLERYLANSLKLLARQGLRNWTCPRLVLDPSASCDAVVFENNVEVAAGARLANCLLLGDNEVGANARLEWCILGPGAGVPPGTALKRVVVSASVGGEGVSPGSIEVSPF